MYEYTVRELMPPPGYGRCEETFSVVFDREKEDLIQLYELSVENKTTRAGFSKLDLTTGEELPGASLELKTSDGRLVDSWISGKTPHLVEGKKYPLLTGTSSRNPFPLQCRRTEIS